LFLFDATITTIKLILVSSVLKFVGARVYEMRAQLNAGHLGESEKIPLLRRLLQHKYSPENAMPDHDIISEMMGHM
jgi:hypothetical protein